MRLLFPACDLVERDRRRDCNLVGPAVFDHGAGAAASRLDPLVGAPQQSPYRSVRTTTSKS